MRIVSYVGINSDIRTKYAIGVFFRKPISIQIGILK